MIVYLNRIYGEATAWKIQLHTQIKLKVQMRLLSYLTERLQASL